VGLRGRSVLLVLVRREWHESPSVAAGISWVPGWSEDRRSAGRRGGRGGNWLCAAGKTLHKLAAYFGGRHLRFRSPLARTGCSDPLQLLLGCDHGDFLKRCHSPIPARTSNDPVSAATTSRSETATLSRPGKIPNMRNNWPPTRAPTSPIPRLRRMPNPLRSRVIISAARLPPKETDNDPNDGLSERRHHTLLLLNSG